MTIINGMITKIFSIGAWYDFTRVVVEGDVCYIPFKIDGDIYKIKLATSVYRKMRGMSFWKWLSRFNPNICAYNTRVYNACLYNRYGVLDGDTIEFDCHYSPSVYDFMHIEINFEQVGDIVEYELMATFNTVK